MNVLLSLCLGLLLMASTASAHPGRLDSDGCHTVRKDFVYQSGKAARKGEYHCHRAAIGKPFKLDGTEVLLERRADTEQDDVEDRTTEETP